MEHVRSTVLICVLVVGVLAESEYNYFSTKENIAEWNHLMNGQKMWLHRPFSSEIWVFLKYLDS
jgi:hypothetical protein